MSILIVIQTLMIAIIATAVLTPLTIILAGVALQGFLKMRVLLGSASWIRNSIPTILAFDNVTDMKYLSTEIL